MTRNMTRFLFLFIFYILTLNSASAACPSGSQYENRYFSTELQMRLNGRGEFHKCLNQDYPDLNNLRDSYGIGRGGKSTFKCENITVYGYMGNPQDIEVMSSVGFVKFYKKIGSYSDFGQPKKFCKGNNCYEEQFETLKWEHGETGTLLESKYIMREIYENCSEITF